MSKQNIKETSKIPITQEGSQKNKCMNEICFISFLLCFVTFNVSLSYFKKSLFFFYFFFFSLSSPMIFPLFAVEAWCKYQLRASEKKKQARKKLIFFKVKVAPYSSCISYLYFFYIRFYVWFFYIQLIFVYGFVTPSHRYGFVILNVLCKEWINYLVKFNEHCLSIRKKNIYENPLFLEFWNYV